MDSENWFSFIWYIVQLSFSTTDSVKLIFGGMAQAFAKNVFLVKENR